jgi:cyclophilin family peptidyl-prolyl cis-trans isomerase
MRRKIMLARTQRWIGCWMAALLAALLSLAGCNKSGDEAIPPHPVVKVDNLGKPIVAQPVARRKGPNLPAFKDAVILDPPPEDEQRPPDMTVNGKNVGRLYETIADDLWDKVTFTNQDGKPIKYQAVLNTELGEIQIDLLGDIAPNHVRSFVCLAKTGYYDGMAFYYSIRRTVEDATVAYIESGCPRGTGEYGSGSIGYWLRPEFSTKLKHEEGVVGACLHRDPNSAACRFYITAAAMPQMDGEFTIFGKVAAGMDIVRTINNRAVQENDRLQQPAVIRNVTIRTLLE